MRASLVITFCLFVMPALAAAQSQATRATLRLRFQLITGADSGTTDASLAGIEAALRDALPLRGYRLLGQGSTMAEEGTPFLLALATVERERYEIRGVSTDVQTGTNGGVRMSVHLSRGQPRADVQRASVLLSTKLRIPLGRTVVIASSATLDDARPLLLIIRPELVPQ